ALRASIAAEAMQRSRESLAHAQSLAGMGNWAIHLDGRFECSAQQFKIYGMPLDTDLRTFARSARNHVVAADRERMSDARRRLSTDGTPYQLEFGIMRVD